MSSVTLAEKTYSGLQSYHEMLVRAQALSPALTYIVCKLLLEIAIVENEFTQRTREIHHVDTEPLSGLFLDSPHSNPLQSPSKVSKFITQIFNGFTVGYSWTDGSNSYTYGSPYLSADTQFVTWLQSGVVTVDDQKKLVTIHV